MTQALRLSLLVSLFGLLASCATPEVMTDPLADFELPEGTRVDLQGVELYYRDVGSGVPIVFLHGAGLDSRMWIGQIAALVDDYRVIVPDLPGFGQSPTPADPYSHSVTLAHLLDTLRIQRAHVVGISEGAEDAIDFSFRFPDSAITLTLASPRLSGRVWSREMFSSFDAVLEASAAGDAQNAAKAWLRHPMLEPAMANTHLAQRVRQIHLDNAKSWLRSSFPQRPEPRAVERLREIDRPALVIVGDRDVESVYEIARQIDRQAVDCRRQVLPRAGHLVNMETPDAFNRLLVAFLRAHADDHASD